MKGELFIGALNLSAFIIVADAVFNKTILLEPLPLELQQELYMLLDLSMPSNTGRLDLPLVVYTPFRNFTINRWQYDDWGSLSDLILYAGFTSGLKLTMDRARWYRQKGDSWLTNIVTTGNFISER